MKYYYFVHCYIGDTNFHINIIMDFDYVVTDFKNIIDEIKNELKEKYIKTYGSIIIDTFNFLYRLNENGEIC